MSVLAKQTPFPVLTLLAVLKFDQSSNPDCFDVKRVSVEDSYSRAQELDTQGGTEEDYALMSACIDQWARRNMQPSALCDECARTMGDGISVFELNDLEYRHVFDSRFNSFFLCENCAEKWLSEGDAGLPRITGLTTRQNHRERWATEGKDPLLPLEPSGALFAGLILRPAKVRA